MKCGNCGSEIPNDSKFCPVCGKDPQPVIAPLTEEARFCSSCGQSIAAGQHFCTACGSEIGVAGSSPGKTVPLAQQQSKEISPKLFWIPLGVLFLLFAILLWGNNTGLLGWIVLIVYFGLVLLGRRFFIRGGCLFNVILWAVIAGIFLVICTVLPVSDNTDNGANAGKSTQNQPDSSAAKSHSSSKGPVERPVPEALKPLIFKGTSPATNVRYMVLEDGDWSYAFLTYNLKKGSYEDIGNGSGEQYWNVNITFYPNEEQAKKSYQGQLETSVKDYQRDIKVYDKFVRKPANKGDEGNLFTGFITQTRFGEYSNYVIRQGATQVWVQKLEHTQKPMIPQGMDKLLAVLKTIDNKSLFTGNSGKTPDTADKNGDSPDTQANLQTISKLTMSTGVKGDTFEPVNPTNTFTKTSPAIYCTGMLTDAPANSTVRFVFYYLENGRTEIAPVEMKAGGTRYTMAYLTAPQKGWPLGKYEVVVFFNGKEAGRVPFMVK